MIDPARAVVKASTIGFEFGVKTLGELLQKLSISVGHEGGVSYGEIAAAAASLGVDLKEERT